MPTTPYAKLLVSINGGAPTSGGLQTTTGAVLQLSGESTVFWKQQRFEISDYPVGFACPAGWSTDPTTGAYFYATSFNPPPVTLGIWGKYMLRLVVNEGLSSGAVDPTLTDTSTALSIPSPNVGLLDMGFGEDLQYSAAKLWTGDAKKNLRQIDTYLAGGVTALSNAVPAAVALVGGAGASTTAARGDHAHALPFGVVQTLLGAASGPIGLNAQPLNHLGNVSFDASIAGPLLGQAQLGGAGAATGQALTVQAQQGQAQTGGAANNNGGTLTLAGGAPGTGGGGVVGVQGSLALQGGGQVVTLQADGLHVAALTLGTQTPAQNTQCPQPSVSIPDGSAAQNLLTAAPFAAGVPIPAGADTTIYFYLQGKVVTPTSILPWKAKMLFGVMNLGGVVTPYWLPGSGGIITAESLLLTSPWGGLLQGPPITVTGATSDGGTQIKLAVSNASGVVAGTTILVKNVVTSGGLVINGSWVVDSTDSTHYVLRGSVWLGGGAAWVSGGDVVPQLSISGVVAGTNMQLQASGITPAPRTPSETVSSGDLRVANGNIYLYTQGGAVSAGGGPSGTGNAQTDGAAKADWVAAVGAGVAVKWTLWKVEVGAA